MADKPKRETRQQQIERLRARIDEIDQRILEQLAQRGECVQQIGQLKTEANRTFHAPARERTLLDQLTEKNPGPYSDEAIETIYREIMSASLALESPLSVAFSASHPRSADAIRHRFGRSARLREEPSPADALEAVAGGWAHYAVIFVEDSKNGFDGPALDALCDSGAPVSGEIVQHEPTRRSRFLIAGGDPPDPSGRDRTSAVFVVRNEPGGLLRLLREFSDREVNLTCIESRPLAGSPWQYRFFIDIDGHQTQENIADALAALEQGGTVYHVLGSYPIAGTET